MAGQMIAIKTDVVICGSGSAGICAAIWLAQAGIAFRFLEQRAGPLEIGQADGVACRTVEIFESYSMSEELLREAYHVNELTFWSSNAGHPERTGYAPDTPPGLSHLPHVILNQARINELLLEKMSSFNPLQQIDYGHRVETVTVDLANSHPVEVVAEHHGQKTLFRAKYALACDGAHSCVRRALGLRMLGDSSDAVWGVMDIFPRTNFPDIRKKSTIHSDMGSIVLIPREGGFMVRFYVQMPAGTDPKRVSLGELHQRAKSILRGFEFEVQHTYWWSAYSIGQRLAEQFSVADRVFLAGDACHTHSPKAGQGMNVSLQDGFNIGWKLAQVLSGRIRPEVLTTYVTERSSVAKELIAFDRLLTSFYDTGHSPSAAERFQTHFLQSAKYMAGLMTKYEHSVLVNIDCSDQTLASNMPLGMRAPTAQVVRVSDALPLQFSKILKSDGRWRIAVFSGDIHKSAGKGNLERAASYLTSSQSPLARYNSTAAPLIEVVLILAGQRHHVEINRDIPTLFYPLDAEHRMNDVNKIFIDDESYHQGHGQAYDSFGIGKEEGCVIVIRPDQYISMITSIDNIENVGGFFDEIMC